LNRLAAENAHRVEDNHNRHCSFSGDSRSGVVLHSAKHRATVFLPGSDKPSRQAALFVARWWSTTDQGQRDKLVESYF
jgi:hypothetical protein